MQWKGLLKCTKWTDNETAKKQKAFKILKNKSQWLSVKGHNKDILKGAT